MAYMFCEARDMSSQLDGVFFMLCSASESIIFMYKERSKKAKC